MPEPLDQSLQALELRLRRLEDREQIRELVARYNWVMDDRDLPGIRDLFTEDVRVHSHDGMIDARGRDEVVRMFQGRFEVLGPSLHWAHDHRISLDEEDPDQATGLLSLHAEMTRFGAAAVSAIRYEDRYRRHTDGQWRFAARRLAYFYYLDPREYAEVLESSMRVRSTANPSPGGFPENSEPWMRYYADFPRPAVEDTMLGKNAPVRGAGTPSAADA
jgi:ketosteroid isomerase-like protein